jgi:hypothetical protein
MREAEGLRQALGELQERSAASLARALSTNKQLQAEKEQLAQEATAARLESSQVCPCVASACTEDRLRRFSLEFHENEATPRHDFVYISWLQTKLLHVG